MTKRNRVEIVIFEFSLPSFVRELVAAKVLCFTVEPELGGSFMVSAPCCVEADFLKAFDKACNSNPARH